MSRYTFKQFQTEYPNDEACLKQLLTSSLAARNQLPVMPSRGEISSHGQRKAYACQACGHHVYPCAGTIFHKSSTPLTKWFFAMYLMTSTRHGVAAKELERQLGVTYKTAWRMAHELRKLMATADYSGPLSGHVEVDETFVGGTQTRKVRAIKGTNKTSVLGIVERGGISAGPVPDRTINTLEPIVRENVLLGSTISTDELPSYNDLSHGYNQDRQSFK